MPLLREIFAGRFARLAPVFIRVPVGFHLVYGTQDNVLSWERMLEFRHFLAQHGFPFPLLCAVLSVSAQCAAGLLYLVGYRTRWAALVMIINFLVAIFAVHLAHGHSYPQTFPALMMLFGSIAILLGGAGAWSLDERRRT